MEEIVVGYRKTRKLLRALRTLNPDKAEREIIGGMMSDCDYALEWLGSGRRPGNKRGVERRAAYQRVRPMDPIRIQAFVQKSKAGSPANLTDSQLQQLEDVLSKLSPRERECYELHYGRCFSWEQIAEMLQVTKSTVQTCLKRASKKIGKF